MEKLQISSEVQIRSPDLASNSAKPFPRRNQPSIHQTKRTVNYFYQSSTVTLATVAEFRRKSSTQDGQSMTQAVGRILTLGDPNNSMIYHIFNIGGELHEQKSKLT